MALITVPVHGQILDPDGLTPAVGTVTFRTLIELRDTVANITYEPASFVATLDVNGEFTINLPTTDNPDITPLNWVYQVYINTTNWRHTQYVQLPFQIGTVEFADLVPLDYDPCVGLPAPAPIPPDTPVPLPGATVVTEQTFGQPSAPGVSLLYSRTDHTHGTPPAPAVPAAGDTVVTEQSFGQASTAGVGAAFSRVDHTHGTMAAPAVPTPADSVVSETAFGQAPAVGVSVEYAREDHTHGTPTAPASPTLVAADTTGILTTGTVTVPTANAVQIGTDLTVPANTGDIIELSVSCLCDSAGGELYWNAATRVAAADVNYFGNGTNAWPHPQGGISSFFTPVAIFTGPRAARSYTVQAGDISAGTVTVRVYARADNSSRDVFITAGQPLEMRLVNYRQ